MALNRERSELNQKHFAEMFYAEVDEPAAEDKSCNQSDQCLTAEESDLYEQTIGDNAIDSKQTIDLRFFLTFLTR